MKQYFKNRQNHHFDLIVIIVKLKTNNKQVSALYLVWALVLTILMAMSFSQQAAKIPRKETPRTPNANSQNQPMLGIPNDESWKQRQHQINLEVYSFVEVNQIELMNLSLVTNI